MHPCNIHRQIRLHAISKRFTLRLHFYPCNLNCRWSKIQNFTRKNWTVFAATFFSFRSINHTAKTNAHPASHSAFHTQKTFYTRLGTNLLQISKHWSRTARIQNRIFSFLKNLSSQSSRQHSMHAHRAIIGRNHKIFCIKIF